MVDRIDKFKDIDKYGGCEILIGIDDDLVDDTNFKKLCY